MTSASGGSGVIVSYNTGHYIISVIIDNTIKLELHSHLTDVIKYAPHREFKIGSWTQITIIHLGPQPPLVMYRRSFRSLCLLSSRIRM